MPIRKIYLTTFALALSIGLAACEKPGSAEKVGAEAGREIDQAAAKTQDKISAASAKLSEQTAKTEVAIEDAAVTARIKAAIVSERGLSVTDINVETVKGVVTLSGIVDSPAQSEHAAALARGVEGVRQVDNRLVLRTQG